MAIFKKLSLKDIHCTCCHSRMNKLALPEPLMEGAEPICLDCQKKIRNSHYEKMIAAKTKAEYNEELALALKEVSSYWFDMKGDQIVREFYEKMKPDFDGENSECAVAKPNSIVAGVTADSLTSLSGNVLVSACLLGTACRYDGASKPNLDVLKLFENPDLHLIPVCPEQLGGLATPRKPAERNGKQVLCKDGTDVTAQYEKGAYETLALAKLYGCKCAILKAKSPSCGSKQIYDGTHSRTLIDGMGVTAELLKSQGIVVISEEELN